MSSKQNTTTRDTQKYSTKTSSTDKCSNKPSGSDKYSKYTTQDKYQNKNGTAAKYSSAKSSTCDKYSSGPSGEKYSSSKKIAEDKYSKSTGVDARSTTKTSSKDTYFKANDESKRKYDDKPFKSSSQSTDNSKSLTSSSVKAQPANKKDGLFGGGKSRDSDQNASWTSRPYSKEQKNRYADADKDDRNRGLGVLGTGAIAGVGLLASAGPRKRKDDRENGSKHNNRHNSIDNNVLDSRRPRASYETVSGEADDSGCCTLL